MVKYIYKLNFPDIKEMLLPHKYEEIFEAITENSKFLYYNPNSYLKKEYLTFKHYQWNSSFLFYKSKGATGDLHSDLPKAAWAINYINLGHGVVKYYDTNVIGPGSMIPDKLGNYRLAWPTPTAAPMEIYTMTSGMHLMRVDVPHIVTGYDSRYALSIRSLDHQQESWDTVVSNFREYFI
jgi:hypothetical protein